MKKLLWISLLSFGSHFIQAQSSAALSFTTSTLTSTLLEVSSDDWTFYVDEENGLYYIDFEAIKTNLNTLIVKDQSGTIIYQEEVFDLPVNTIYELDLSEFDHGHYVVELHSFTEVIRKGIDL